MDQQNEPTEADKEFAAMQTVYKALSDLAEDARSRVLSYIASRLGIAGTLPKAKGGKTAANMGGGDDEDVSTPSSGNAAPAYGSFAELFDAAQPQTAAQKALVAGYWLQVCEGAENFDSQRSNKELKNLGHGLANVTAAIEALKTQSPALALQLKKSGTSQQARKTYKITVAGETAVKAMING